jgi:hypothetical protein
VVDSDRGAMSRVRSRTIVSAVQFLWNCREAALHIISPVAIERQLNFLMFRLLCAADRKFLSEIFLGASAAVCDLRPCNLLIWQIGSQSHPVMIEFGVSDILQLCHEQTFRACSTNSEFSCGVDTIARPAVHNRENSARCKIFVILIRQ